MSLSNDATLTMPVAPAYSAGGYGSNGSMWGGDWSAWIILFLIWGAFGGGWGNGFGGGFGGANGPGFQGYATRSDINEGFALNGLQNGQTSIKDAVTNGFHGVDNAVCQLGYQTQTAVSGLGTQLQQCCCDLGRSIDHATFQTAQGINGIGSKIDSCCCETQRQIERGFCDTNYNLATNTTAIIQNAHNDTDRVIAKLDAMEMARKDETISELRSQVNALNLAQSQANQNTYLINTLRPCPQPAYLSCNPWAGSGYGGCGTYSTCGCGC